MEKPLVAITLGDPAGVGPETVAAAWRSEALHEACRPIAIGFPDVLRRAVSLLDSPSEVVEVTAPEEAVSTAGTICCLPCGTPAAAQVPPATIDSRGGQAAFDALSLAAELALADRVDAIATAPLNKAALWKAGHHVPGHTELLAQICATPDVAMMLYLPPGPQIAGRAGLGVIHATLHTALRNVFSQLSRERIVTAVQLADSVMRTLTGGDNAPRIGVSALNPHAGEQGLFGDEEQEIILPAVEQAVQHGIRATGPLPCDTLMVRAAAGEFDAVVAMYHDQGHIALKLLDMHRAVNVTLGLPIIRTSVAHGTAFDLAWQGRAEASGMIEAVTLAAKLARCRQSTLRVV